MKSVARLRVELLARQQLEEAREREQRRPQLVRGVGDELGARAVERGEPHAHAVERARELSELVRDRCRRSAPRTRPSAIRAAAVSSRRIRRAKSVARPQPSTSAKTVAIALAASTRVRTTPTEVEVVAERRREHHDRELRQRVGDLGVELAVPRHRPLRHAAPRLLVRAERVALDRLPRHLVVDDVDAGQRPRRRIRVRPHDQLAVALLEDDDARVDERLRLLPGPLRRQVDRHRVRDDVLQVRRPSRSSRWSISELL